jgi:alkylated DNA repair dioxygenase AlkB
VSEAFPNSIPKTGALLACNPDSPDPACELLPLPGAVLHYYPEFLTASESARLLQNFLQQTPWRQDNLRFGGKMVAVPRLQAWYGNATSHYGYSGLRLSPLPWTAVLSGLRERIETVLKLPFNSVLLNYYRDGNDSVAWHSDDERELGPDPQIASLSLGAPRKFELKHRSEARHGKLSLMLGDGSLLLMGSGLQQNWLHQLPKTPGLQSPRLNLTFRFIHAMA